MFKKIYVFLFCAFIFLPILNVSAQENNSVNIYFFRGEGCPHCGKEEVFLKELKNKYQNVSVYDFEVWYNSKNRDLLSKVGDKLNANISGVPFTVIGDKTFIGFSEGLTSTEIENQVKSCSLNKCPDSVAEIVGVEVSDTNNKPGNGEEVVEGKGVIPEKINFPIIGEVETKNFSLPVFTIVIGALDGFNPCAMWTLLFLISLLLGMENRKRMWILGSAFIAASALVYFVFMAAWLNLLLFIGFIIWVRVIIGLVALGGGWYNLKEYFTKPDAVCDVAGSEKKQQVFEKLKNIAHQKKFYLALGGIILLAFAVNLVELICSAGLPAVYTQVLALSNLTKLQYYLYLLLYIFVFMLDDLIVFFIAMSTLRMTKITTKYSRFSHLVGGILMLLVGALLILRPEWLMFG